MEPLRYACSAAFLLAATVVAQAEELRVLSVGSAEIAIKTLIPEFNKDGTRPFKFEWGPPNKVWDRIKAGEAFDVFILSEPAMQELQKASGIKTESRIGLARTGLGVVVPSSMQSPDLSTTENFKKSILAAKAILYRDPSLPNMSGEMVERVLKKIDVLDLVKPRMKVSPRPEAEALVAAGKSDFSFVNISEIPTSPDIRYAGPLPKDLQLYTNLETALAAKGSQSQAAKDFIALISGEKAKSAWEKAGFEMAYTYQKARTN
jgi:molybdate transport system substrate-binding protein